MEKKWVFWAGWVWTIFWAVVSFGVLIFGDLSSSLIRAVVGGGILLGAVGLVVMKVHMQAAVEAWKRSR